MHAATALAGRGRRAGHKRSAAHPKMRLHLLPVNRISLSSVPGGPEAYSPQAPRVPACPELVSDRVVAVFGRGVLFAGFRRVAVPICSERHRDMSANYTCQVPMANAVTARPAAARWPGASAGAWQGFRLFPGGLRCGQRNAAAPAGPGLVAISPKPCPGRGRERRPPRAAPEVLMAAGVGLIGPVIWGQRGGRVSAHARGGPDSA